ncbi:glycosyltransferase family 39 protein [Patescibacteria group bacterium]|nr:glycosyltransferase family 39 protein [Patescibacteria group bacterium]
MRRNKTFFIALVIFLIAISLRFAINRSPFWVDEFSTAEQAKLMIKHGFNIFNQSTDYFESHNITTHFLVATFFKILGTGEWQARLPMIFIGSLVPVAIYFFVKSILDNKSAILSSIIYIFSYWQITWARQARGYVLQQLLTLLSLYVYQSLIVKFTKTKAGLLVFLVVLGLLTHTTYALIVGAMILHFLITKNIKNISLSKIPLITLFGLALCSILFYTGQLNTIYKNIVNILANTPNNLPYYHSFLWREQTIITLFSFIGVFYLVFKERKFKALSLLTLPIGFYLLFVCFLFAPYVSRYLLPIFPLLIILAGFAISKISESISSKQSLYVGLAIVFFIIINGNKFVLKPKVFYSVNHDMREIALIDYHQVYDLIKQKGKIDEGKTAVIDTWPDRLKWYLGENQDYFYAFRWLKSEGLVNGLPKSTNFELNSNSEKIIPRTGDPAIKIIGELNDLQMAMKKYQYGFIWIDDSSLPEEVVTYVQNNFKKELYLDHYSLDDNPYSIWPGTLYSWGFDSINPFYKSL